MMYVRTNEVYVTNENKRKWPLMFQVTNNYFTISPMLDYWLLKREELLLRIINKYNFIYSIAI